MLDENRYWARRVRRLSRRRFLGVAGAGAAAALAACGGGGNPTKSAAPAGGQGGASTKQLSTVAVGGFVDRTGAVANIGNLAGDGAKDWVEYANSVNLGGRKVNWDEFNHNYEVDKAKEGYKKFIEQDKVSAFLSFSTPVTTALAPSADDDKTPMFTPGFGLSDSADGKKFPYVFVGAASYGSQAMALLGYVKDTWKDSSRKPKALYMYYGNDAGREPLDLIKAQAPKLGIDLLSTVEIPATTTDMTEQLADVKSRDPDFLLTHLFGAPPALSMKAAQKVGFPATRMYSFVWGGGQYDFTVAGPASEGYFNLQFTAEPSDNPDAYQRLRDYWKKAGKTEDTKKTGDVYYTRGVFNAAFIVDAIKAAGDKDTLTGDDVKKGLESFKDNKLYGLSPGITLSATDHGGTRKVRLYQVKNGVNTMVKDWFEGPQPS